MADERTGKREGQMGVTRYLLIFLLYSLTANGKVIIADGYHCLCSVYGFDEDAVIPCKIV